MKKLLLLCLFLLVFKPQLGFAITCDEAKTKSSALLKEIATLQQTDTVGDSLQAKLKEYNDLLKDNAKCLKKDGVLPFSLAGDNLRCGSDKDAEYYDPFFAKIAYCILYKSKEVTTGVTNAIFANAALKALGLSAVAIYIMIFAYRVMLGRVQNLFSESITTIFFASFAVLAMNVDMVQLITDGIGDFGIIIQNSTAGSFGESVGTNGVLANVFQKLTQMFLSVISIGAFDANGKDQITACVSNYNPYTYSIIGTSIFTVAFAFLFAGGMGFFIVLAFIMLVFYFIRLAINVFLIYITTQLAFLILASFITIFAPLAIFKKFRKMLNAITEMLVGNAVFFGLFVGAFFFGFNILEKSNENLCQAYSLLNNKSVQFKSLSTGNIITSDQINSAVSGSYGGSASDAALQDFINNNCKGGGGSGSGSSTCIGGNPEATKVAGHNVSDRCWPHIGTDVGDGFGYIPRRGRNHNGLDINHPSIDAGAAIYANAYGIVKSVALGYNGGLGNTVYIYDCNSITTVYAHLLNGGISIKKGDIVEAGQQIAKEGNTGASQGAHLHFQCHPNDGAPQNPIGICVESPSNYSPSGATGVAGADNSSTEYGKDSSDIYVPVILLADQTNGLAEFFNRLLTHLIIIYFIFQFYENILAFFGRLLGLYGAGNQMTETVTNMFRITDKVQTAAYSQAREIARKIL